MKQPSVIPLWLIGFGILAAIAVYTACAHQAFFRTEPDSNFSEYSP